MRGRWLLLSKCTWLPFQPATQFSWQFSWQSPASVTLYGGGETAQGAREAPHTLWDLLVVLRALTGPPFEPLETVDIKFVSLKTALLLALTSAKRVGDMQALSVSPSCIQFSIAGDRVVMRPNAAYTPKVVASFGLIDP